MMLSNRHNFSFF